MSFWYFNSGIPKFEYGSTKNNDDALKHIVKLGKLLSHFRGVIQIWEIKETQDSNYSYYLPIMENLPKAIPCLRNLADGHSLIRGQNKITIDDIPMIMRVVLSNAPIDRVKIFDLL